MENFSTKDFFKGMISHSVDNGKLKIWSLDGVHVAQPYQKERVSVENQPTLFEIESEDGKKIFVAMSKDGKRCAISTDELMTYELYWTADRAAGDDGINVSPSTNLHKWEKTTIQVAEGTIGFVRDEISCSKYVTAGTNGTKNLPENNFQETLEKILEELKEHEERISGMSGEEGRKKTVLGTYKKSITNVEGIIGVAKKIVRDYEENEIKENMALKAKLTEDLAKIELHIKKIKNNIAKGNYTFENVGEMELAQAEERKTEKIAEIQSYFGSSQSDDTEGR